MENILNGKQVAKEIKEKLSLRVQEIKKQGCEPQMAIIRVGEDPASIIYLKHKKIACESIGIKYKEIILPNKISEQELISKIDEINNDNSIHGLIVQFPLPKHISKKKIMKIINPIKDVDGLHPINISKMHQGIEGLKPCTPLGIITLLKYYGIKIEGLDAVVIGRSKIVGEPVSKMLLMENATVTTCFSKTKDITKYTKTADLIIAAAGSPHLITKEKVKKGAILIDVGVSRVNGKIFGDIDFENLKEDALWITPNPGGVGPMTIASLLTNLVKAIEFQNNNK
ncbi:bifunctional 5,10-methylenetetrahydrofolate dehydrogenase/5,10-methenyltetrahydrofolate cyclohydrolase [Mycoplasma marinum]|uniref:Bifunctional protein FolD n=1 Tax=Mycoplasma marinum TaxID=1937190 RepID=A0A4R0XQA6_9MOLU|nr:tetrahydrofolate dehydrogenase/cyclohydrolase catalytic domain-containing protein [Mycoplasma marinum]TCG11755.1 bifunctional methylenetetrahydrofolate dehydrogenase/methenyltetrahydrofolate cyclohydrolase [Mycoplasma marinum]